MLIRISSAPAPRARGAPAQDIRRLIQTTSPSPIAPSRPASGADTTMQSCERRPRVPAQRERPPDAVRFVAPRPGFSPGSTAFTTA